MKKIEKMHCQKKLQTILFLFSIIGDASQRVYLPFINMNLVIFYYFNIFYALLKIFVKQWKVWIT